MTFDVISAARRRTRNVVIVALLVSAGVAGVVGLAMNPAPWRNGPTPAPTYVATPAPASTELATSPAPPGDLLPPVGVTWMPLAGVDLPVSAATGPTEVVGDLARGFAQSRAGAVVAALHLLVRTTAQVGPAVFEPTIDEQVTGEHATAMRYVVGDLYRAGAARAGVTYGQPLGDLPARLVGIRLDSFSEAQAVVSVLAAAPDATGATHCAATPVTVVWSDGDWRLLAPPGGAWDDLVRIVDQAEAAGYTPITGG